MEQPISASSISLALFLLLSHQWEQKNKEEKLCCKQYPALSATPKSLEKGT